MTPKFKIGDKLEALDWHKEEHGLEFVTITGINEETKVYYWFADLKWELGGKLSSGYYFHEAKAYKPKNQTSIDWLYNELFPKKLDGFSESEWEIIDKAFEQAKLKHKEEVTSFTADWSVQYKYEDGKSINKYYNETFE